MDFFTPTILCYVVSIIAIATTPAPFLVMVYFLMAKSSVTLEELGFYTIFLVVGSALAMFRQGAKDD